MGHMIDTKHSLGRLKRKLSIPRKYLGTSEPLMFPTAPMETLVSISPWDSLSLPLSFFKVCLHPFELPRPAEWVQVYAWHFSVKLTT